MKAPLKLWFTILSAGLTVLVVIVLTSQPARTAGPWYVAPGGSDSNSCLSAIAPCATINGAIGKASPGDTIYVTTGTYTGTGDEVVSLDKDVTLSGGWDSTFTAQSVTSTIDGEEARRGITVNSSVTALVERFTVQNGLVDSGAGGGGILNTGDSLTINNSTVSGNMTSGRGGGIRNYHGSTLSLNSSIISGNTGDAGGGISNEAYMNLNNSTVSGNTANVNGGGGIRNDGDLDLNSSTVSDNDSLGIPANSPSGGGIYSVFGTMTLNNSTVSNNMASSARGGGIFNYGSTITLNNSTVSRNTAIFGGGIYNNSGSITSAIVILKNSIVAGNTASESGPDCIRIDSTGHNLIDDTSGCTFTPTNGDLTDIDARLLPLTGSPGYHPLSRLSPAVDAGNPNGCEDHLGNPLVTDQRGVARVGRCDIGSYEYDPASDPFNYIFLACITNNYCPDFFDEFNNPASGWFVWEDETAQWEYLEGEYRILTNDDSYGFYYAHAPTCARENYTVEVDARWVGDPGYHYGIFWDSNRNINDQFYMFGVNTDYQDYYLDHYDGVEWHTIIPWTVSPYINGGIASNHLKITRNGFQITLEVNGIVLVTLTDANLTGRTYTGIFSGPYYGYPTSDARFDNISVTQVNSVEQSSGIHSSSMTPDISPRKYKLALHRQNYMISSKQSKR